MPVSHDEGEAPDMGGRKPQIRRQPPVMGADTRAVLAEAGYTAVQIDELVEQRVVIAADARHS